ncbi:MAG TPA: hypothetical protein VD833_17760 [Vicinamibacterales bacterium]|nr:hypothetical protein [Vicinamibacterales bacterium]
MARPKPPSEPGTDLPGKPAASAGRAKPAMLVVPRGWLVAVLMIVLAPWLIVAMLYSRVPVPAAVSPAPAAAATGIATSGGDPGARGQLLTTPIVISPPVEYVPTDWGPIEPPTWHFPNATMPQVEAVFAGSGLSAGEVSALMAAAKPAPAIKGVIVTPDPALARSLKPDVRAHIYLMLAGTPLNVRQRDAYRYYGSSAEAWLAASAVSAETRRLVDPLIYRQGDFLYFADIDLVRPHITDAAELQRLAKALLREATLLVGLRLDERADVDRIAEYWGRGGRRTDVRPLLESVAGADGPQTFDVSHLLPTFARQHLYRYPRVTLADLERTAFVNCFWTALNFFNQEPDDRYLDDRWAIERLKRDYYIVHDQLQLGDIAAFADARGRYFHAAVYLADNLVFGKNGNSPLAPWTIVPIERLKGYYVEYADEWNVIYYRRKDL